MQLDIVGGSYKSKYVDMNPQRTINWYVQKDAIEDEDSKFKEALVPFPGLGIFSTTGDNRTNRVQFIANTIDFNRYFVVSDNILFEVTDAIGTIVQIGVMTDIPIDNTPVFMEVNLNNQVMIAHRAASYCFDMTTNILTKITDVNFPGNVEYLSYTQGYMLVTSGGRVYYNLADITNWTDLNTNGIFTPGAYANRLKAAIVWRDDIHCFCENSVEIYIFDGTSPFSKQYRSTLDVGLVSAQSISKYKDGIFFVGRTTKGQYRIYFYNATECVQVSTANIDWQLNNPAVVFGQGTWDSLLQFTWDQWYVYWSSIYGNITTDIQYSTDSHIFYYINVPFLDTTFVYDPTVKEWVERQSYAPLRQVNGEFRGFSLINFNGENIWLDKQSGALLQETFFDATEVGNVITRTRITKVSSQEKKNLSIDAFEIDCTSGAGLLTNPDLPANLFFSFSRDGGHTFKPPRTLSTGVYGDYTKRTRTRSLGTARNWVFQIEQTDNAFIMLQSAVINGVVDSY